MGYYDEKTKERVWERDCYAHDLEEAAEAAREGREPRFWRDRLHYGPECGSLDARSLSNLPEVRFAHDAAEVAESHGKAALTNKFLIGLADPHAFRALDWPMNVRLRAALAGSRAYVVSYFHTCPDCFGVGCGACREVGWVPEGLLDECPDLRDDDHDEDCPHCHGRSWVRAERLASGERF